MTSPIRSQSPPRETIVAQATPPGAGGVAVLRLSGPAALHIGRSLFRSADKHFQDFQPRMLHFGRIEDQGGRILDEVLAVFMPGPHSYTGEDVLEIHCHGGNAAPAAILSVLLKAGARLAHRGEFTQRAFLNGRMDLTQAEAVAELIAAPTKAALHLAQAKLAGGLGRRVDSLRQRLDMLRAQLCLAVDFPEEDVECLPLEELAQGAEQALAEVTALLTAMERAKAWREGVMAVLAGRVNAGKSSLLNALLGRERAIVTDLPGTTRDYLEEQVDLNGLRVRLVDTAGLRELGGAGDAVEAAGMERSRELAQRADLVLFVADGSQPLTASDLEEALQFGAQHTLAVISKADLPTALLNPAEALAEQGLEIVRVSAKSGEGLDLLAERIRQRCTQGESEPDPDEAVPNARQAALLAEAVLELQALRDDALSGIPHDLLGVRLEAACNLLASLTGEIAPQDVLNSIFDSFCIGK
ncbi:MAG: tRNA uridine-5-carboxymethylaminomethyl(34) synthesis GTPase MnmE [Desulfovibrionaceae bacterium]